MTQKEIIARLGGLFPPVVTPYDRRGEVDYRLFRENLRRYVGIGLSGIVVAGSTGEAPYLSDRERLKLVEAARGIVRPPELLIAGTGLESTAATLRLSREAVACGADAVLLLTPSYYKSRMNSQALSAHFRALADALTRPIIMYNIPQFTGVKMEPDPIAALSGYPNIVGLKESSGDLQYVRAILRRVRRGFRVLVGSPVIFLEALRAGAAGGVLGLCGFAPEICLGIYDAFRKRRMEQARDLQRRLGVLAQKIGAPYGVPGMKVGCDLCGYRGGPPRAPLTPLNAAQRRDVAAAIREARAGLEI
ncbi:MAG: dihydrodipicolinate synthase family protein [Acidobacteriia bacterium]|nr:dihydrodipicolinate synthase family protein [Terriglobia bacterium]